jgi:ketosteroid isomerase-like protein
MRNCIGVMLLALASATTAGAQSDRRTTVVTAERAVSEVAWDKGLAPALDGALLDDAVLLWPGAPIVVGKAQIARFLAAQPSSLSSARFMWQPMHIEVAPGGTLALVWGVMVVNRPAADGAMALHRIGRYLAVWRRASGTAWRLAVLAPAGVVPAAETAWNDSLGPRALPEMLRSPASVAVRADGREFAVADSSFAADSRHNRTAAAFGKWAAPDAVTFAGDGELNIGAARIRAAIAAGGDAEWVWAPVLARNTPDRNAIGYTIGQATITSTSAGGKVEVSKSKYLTFWRRGPDGSIRFIADGGSARP